MIGKDITSLYLLTAKQFEEISEEIAETRQRELNKLRDLTSFSLYDNQLLTEIGQFTQLTLLSLESKDLTYFPIEITQLTQLSYLSLWNNQITYIPKEIGQLRQLNILQLGYNQLTYIPLEITQLTQLIELYLNNNPIENLLNPIIDRFLQRLDNRDIQYNNTIYGDTQNVHSSSIQKSIQSSIYRLMNSYNPLYQLNYLDCDILTSKTKQFITEYIDCDDVHTMLNITFKELFIAVSIEIDSLTLELQKEIKQRLNEEMQDSKCKCFTGIISRLVNCLSSYSEKVKISISENEEIGNIISVIMDKRGMKTVETLKSEVATALKERGYEDTIISEWLEYVE